MSALSSLQADYHWAKVQVRPWVGDKYWIPEIFPDRVVVLGESNYTTPEQFTPDLVIDCVRRHLAKNDDPNFSRFATKTLRLAFGNNPGITRAQFWNNIAFYNFVQQRVGELARERPTEDMWRSSAEAFEELLKLLQPKRLWVLGKANWNNLLLRMKNSRIDEFTAALGPPAARVLASYTNHPSSSLRYAKWAPIARRLLLEEIGLASKGLAR